MSIKNLKINKKALTVIAGAGTIVLLSGGFLALHSCSNNQDEINPTSSAIISMVPMLSASDTIIPTSTPDVTVSVQPTPTSTPDVIVTETPEPIIPSATPSAIPTVKPVNPTSAPSVRPTPIPTPTPAIPSATPSIEPSIKPVDNTYMKEASAIIERCSTKIGQIKDNSKVIDKLINDLNTQYLSYKADATILEKKLAEADKLIKENTNSAIAQDLKNHRNEIQNQLYKAMEKADAVLKIINKLTTENKKLDTANMSKEIENLQKQVSNVKNDTDLNSYRELERQVNELLKQSENLKNQNEKMDISVDHKPVTDAEKALDNMKDTIEKNKTPEPTRRPSNGGGSSSGNRPTPSPSPSPEPSPSPSPVPSPEPSPDVDHTYDHNGNVDETHIKDNDEPLEEPDWDLPEPTAEKTLALRYKPNNSKI